MIPSFAALREAIPELYAILDSHIHSDISNIITSYCVPNISKKQPIPLYELGVFGIEEVGNTEDGLYGLAAGNHLDILVKCDEKRIISGDLYNNILNFAISHGAADVYRYFRREKAITEINTINKMALHDSFNELLIENNVEHVPENLFPELCEKGAICNLRKFFNISKISIAFVKQGLVNALNTGRSDVVNMIIERFNHGIKRNIDTTSLEPLLNKTELLHIFFSHANVKVLKYYMNLCDIKTLSHMVKCFTPTDVIYIYKNNTNRFKKIYKFINCHNELCDYIRHAEMGDINISLIEFLSRDPLMASANWFTVAEKIILDKRYMNGISKWALHNCILTPNLMTCVIDKLEIEYTRYLMKVANITLRDCLLLCTHHPRKDNIYQYYSDKTE